MANEQTTDTSAIHPVDHLTAGTAVPATGAEKQALQPAAALLNQTATLSDISPVVAGHGEQGSTLLPRALADTIHHGVSQHSADDEPVTVVGIVSLDQKDIETIDREFGGGQKIHTRVEVFDLFSSQSGGGSPINGQAQPEAASPPVLGSKPD